jgi:MFS family permease
MLKDEQELVQEVVREHRERPREGLVLHRDPVDMPLPQAVRYVLAVPTNRVLILASALGYLFFAGVQTFAVLLLRSRYGLGQSAASSLLLVVGLGALVGVVLSGRLADRLLARGRVSARIVVAAGGFMIAAAIFLPAVLSPVLIVSMPLLVLGAAALAAPDPPLNAARLDIMHPRLWGRAEGVRTVLQMLALAAGPLIFGFISGALGGPDKTINGSGVVRHTDALAYTFLIMLVPVALAGLSLLWARRTYPSDVATATASIEATAEPSTRPKATSPERSAQPPERPVMLRTNQAIEQHPSDSRRQAGPVRG